MGYATEIRLYNTRFIESLQRLRWVRRVAVIKESKPCEACTALVDAYETDELPMLPVKGCAKADRCTCWYAAITTTVAA